MNRLGPILLLLASACTTYDRARIPQGFLGLDAAVEELPPRQAFLGIQVAANESESLEDLEIRPGVRVLTVDTGSPAEQAGIRPGDVVLNFESVQVNDPDRLESLLLGIQEDRQVVMRIERGTRVFDLDIQLVARDPVGQGRTLYYVDYGLVRAAFQNDRSDGAYPVVARLAEDSPMRAAGVQVDEAVVSFQGADPGSARELVRRIGLELKPGDEVVMEVRDRAGARREVRFEAWSPGRVLTGSMFWPFWVWEADPAEDHEVLHIGDLIILSLFKRERLGEETEYTVFVFFSWRTGEAVLESSGLQTAPSSVGSP